MTQPINYYAILDIPRDATIQQIKEAAQKQLARFPSVDTAIRQDPDYQQLIQAYKILSDPNHRTAYDLTLDKQSPLLNVKVKASRDQIDANDTTQLVYFLIDISPVVQKEQTTLPLNLSIVIDRSTSMQGARIERVKTAVEQIIQKLAPEDVISIVTFSDRADVILPAGRATNKRNLTARIRSIDTSGGTEIYQGLTAGAQQLQQMPLSQYVNHLILLTDGHTYGDATDCLNLTERLAQAGVEVSAFGIGTEWNDEFLDQLVSPSGGQSAYIETPSQIVDHLQSKVNGLGQIYAQNVSFGLDMPPNVEIKSGFKLIPFAQPLSISKKEINLGNIEGQAPLTFLLEAIITPQTTQGQLNIPIAITANISSPQRNGYQITKEYSLTITPNAPQTEPPRTIVKAVRVVNLYRMNEKAWTEIEAGQFDMATARMRHISTRLLEAGEAKLAEQAYAETERLSTMHTLSVEGRKRLKYGTRSMISQAFTEFTIEDFEE